MNKHIITALVTNQSGVLTRISGLFARRGYNISSLSVCNTENENFSRMTIVAEGDYATILQITHQLDKLIDVIHVNVFDTESTVTRELLLIKINMMPSQLPEIESACKTYKAKTIDLSPESVIIEMTGVPTKIDGFINFMKPYGIIELVRTGLTALERGKKSITDEVNE